MNLNILFELLCFCLNLKHELTYNYKVIAVTYMSSNINCTSLKCVNLTAIVRILTWWVLVSLPCARDLCPRDRYHGDWKTAGCVGTGLGCCVCLGCCACLHQCLPNYIVVCLQHVCSLIPRVGFCA